MMEFKETFDKILSQGRKNVEDIFDSIWNMRSEDVYQCYTKNNYEMCDKSEEDANRLRNKGNKYYAAKDMEKALEFYNLSIMCAPHPLIEKEDLSYLQDPANGDAFEFPIIESSRYGEARRFESTTLAKGFANRSAVLFELHLYEKCIQDIDWAIEFHYPEDLRSKLESRRQRCLECRESGLEYVPKMQGNQMINEKLTNMSSRVKQKNCDYLKNYLEPAMSMFNIFGYTNTVLSLNERLCSKLETAPELVEANPLANSLSSSVKIFHKHGQGRGLMAVRKIEMFEVIGVERASICGLQEDRLKTKCSTCFCTCLTPLPCPGCSRVIFCSKSCRTRGLAEDHWLDCKIYPQLIESGFGIPSGNRYKILKTLSYKLLKDFTRKLDNETPPRRPEYKGFSSRGIYSSTSYKSIHHLDYGTSGFPYEMLVNECLQSFIITKFLMMSGRFFINKNGDPLIPTKEEFLDTCRIMLDNCSKKSVNSYNLAQGEGKCWGVFSALSLINHSCDPSVIFRSFGRNGYIFAIKPIQVGEEVTVSYHGSYDEITKEERQRILLTHYNFICKCEACVENWQPGMLNFNKLMHCFK